MVRCWRNKDSESFQTILVDVPPTPLFFFWVHGTRNSFPPLLFLTILIYHHRWGYLGNFLRILGLVVHRESIYPSVPTRGRFPWPFRVTEVTTVWFSFRPSKLVSRDTTHRHFFCTTSSKMVCTSSDLKKVVLSLLCSLISIRPPILTPSSLKHGVEDLHPLWSTVFEVTVEVRPTLL